MKIILDAGHGIDTPGKRSPDGLFREYKYCRELATLVKQKLQTEDYEVIYLCEGVELDTNLKTRCKMINQLCANHGAKNCIAVSIHNNAASSSGWNKARGWSVFVGLNASENSKKLASALFDAATELGVKTRRPDREHKYWEQNLAICRDTKCPAVLIENMFQDNKEDVEWMLTDAGKQTLVNIICEGIKNYLANI